MLALGLIAVLHVAPAQSAPSVLDQVGRIHLAQAEAPADAPLQHDPRSLFELTRDYQRLQDDRPGLGFPIAFMAIGTAVVALDVAIILLSLASVSAFTLSSLALVVAMGVIGAAFLTTGIIVFPFRLKKRAEIDKQLEELALLIRQREREAPPPVPPAYDLPPPPPPPPPPPVGREAGPLPGILLAEF